MYRNRLALEPNNVIHGARPCKWVLIMKKQKKFIVKTQEYKVVNCPPVAHLYILLTPQSTISDKGYVMEQNVCPSVVKTNFCKKIEGR